MIYHAIGKIIRTIEYFKPIIEISIIGTSEYRKKDCPAIYFLILFLSTFFIDRSFIFSIKTPIIAIIKIAI